MNLEFLRHLYKESEFREESGYVSVYLDTSPTEATQGEVALRWRAARGELAGAGADDPTLDAVTRQLTGRPPNSPGLAVFACAGAVRLAAPLPRAPAGEDARYAPLPHVVPLLASWATAPPHVRVTASRTGARVLACPAPLEERQGASDTTFQGENWPVHNVSRGGWSERNLQRSTAETWADNARRIAELTAGIAHDMRAAFVLVGGDVRERAAVIDALPVVLRDTAIVVDREANPDSASFAAAAAAESARRQAEQGGAVLGDFLAQLGRDDPAQRRAVEGLDTTLTALRDGQAASVLLAYDPSSPRQAWVGPELTDAAASADQLCGPGLANPLRDRVDAAVARAVCGTGAELFFLPPDAEPPADGIGALLRAPFSVPPSASPAS